MDNNQNKNYYPFIPLILFALAFFWVNGKFELVLGVLLGIFFSALVTGPELRRLNLLNKPEREAE